MCKNRYRHLELGFLFFSVARENSKRINYVLHRARASCVRVYIRLAVICREMRVCVI